jgi:ketosteroid isomerase-like protein
MSNTALKFARAHFEAQAKKDIDEVMAGVAKDIIVDSPFGRIEGAAAYKEYQEGFYRSLEKLSLDAAFGDDREALLIYRVDMKELKGAYAAEHLTVKDGKIITSRVIYDRAPILATQPVQR